MQTLFLPAVILLSSFIFALITLTVYSLWHDEKSRHKKAPVSWPENGHVDNNEKKAQEIIHHAQEEARRILAEAELAGIRTVAAKKVNTVELEKSYSQDLSSLTAEAIKELTLASGEIKKRYEQFVSESENIIGHHISQNQARLDSHMTQTIEANEKAFHEFLALQQKKLDEAFAKEISQVESLVGSYYKKRLALVDTQIVDLIAQATKITIGKTLNFTQHTDIILESLEEAKSSGFFSHNDNAK